ncbi:MAG: class I SAM-dependent methyltransferase [Bacteroidota bacterium]
MSATDLFIHAFHQSLNDGSLVKCTLSKSASSTPETPKNVFIRAVLLKKGLHAAFNYRFTNRDEVKNFTPGEAGDKLRSMLGSMFLNASLLTTSRDLTLQIKPDGDARLSENAASQVQAPARTHDREKHRLLDSSAPWLRMLGITSASGEILANAQDKWRQINKYLEIVGALLRETRLPADAHIADMGSGKGYLTFALYDYMVNSLGMTPHITGIELRQPLVDTCNQAARESGFDGLSFMARDIRQYTPERLDMLIALHACDTATDLALAAGIRNKARIIVAAPCCHKQIRRDMSPKNEMTPVLRHGILEERQAEIITDGIRALLLESEGYHTKVFEFISAEHTAKNVMITAVMGKKDPKKRQKALEEVKAIKERYGITTHELEKLL